MKEYVSFVSILPVCFLEEVHSQSPVDPVLLC